MIALVLRTLRALPTDRAAVIPSQLMLLVEYSILLLYQGLFSCLHQQARKTHEHVFNLTRLESAFGPIELCSNFNYLPLFCLHLSLELFVLGT